MTISYGEVAALTAELVAIDSTNPDLVPGGAGEAEIARFVATCHCGVLCMKPGAGPKGIG